MEEPGDLIDVVPFAARKERACSHDYEVWWEDPREITRVSARFASGAVPSPDAVSLEYWQQAWPQIRVPKGADVGSGREGWLAIDDWTNGRWQKADCVITVTGNVLSFTFRALNRQEFPDEKDFPARFRRTLKLRLHFKDTGQAM